MTQRVSTVSYLQSEETLRRRELVWGMVREPAAPLYNHQALLLSIASRLDRHARRHRLGVVAVAPIDVVLDKVRGLVLQPDVVFVAAERTQIIRGQIWGAPDLVIEVISRSSARYDRGEKLSWYRQYGVRECWIVDRLAEAVDVITFGRPDTPGTRRRFEGRRCLRSVVLPCLRLQPRRLFD
jgi:Uma2 family endonuclease